MNLVFILPVLFVVAVLFFLFFNQRRRNRPGHEPDRSDQTEPKELTGTHQQRHREGSGSSASTG